MDDDIVTMLRKEWEYGNAGGPTDYEMYESAADEIERLRTEIERLQAEKKELLEAIRLTAEYYLPPALDNWEWWKVYGKYADPEDAQRMKDYCDKAMAQEARRG